MADYYPLIARAVSGAEKNTAESRRALYERARAALLGQLRSVTPPLSESDITRERLALEEAIRKVEADAVRQARIESIRAPEDPPPTPPPVDAPPRDIFTPPPDRPPVVTPLPEGEAAPKGSLLDNALQGYRSGIGAEMPPRPPTEPVVRPAARGPRNGDAAGSDVRPEARPPRSWQEAPPADPVGPDANEAADDVAPRVEMPPPGRLGRGAGREPPAFSPEPAASAYEPEDLDAAPPPPPVATRRRPLGRIIALLVLLVVLGASAAVIYSQFDNLSLLVRSAKGPSTPASPSTAAKDSGVAQPPQKIPDRVQPSGADQARPDQSPAAQVAQRVVLYEEDPSDPQGKRLVGSAIWRTETVSPGANQAPELAVKADIEIPERRMGMTFSLRRNTDPALPASHTIEIVFKVPPDVSGGGVANVPGVLMKQAEQARGVPLAGVAVKVTNGYFLIALYSVDAEKERNIKLLKERAWFDIPIVYANGRRAILAMEKGVPGERAFNEAFAAWGE